MSRRSQVAAGLRGGRRRSLNCDRMAADGRRSIVRVFDVRLGRKTRGGGVTVG